MPYFFFLSLAGILIFAGLSIWYNKQAAKKRTEGYARQAESLGLEFSEKRGDLIDRISNFRLSQTGRAKKTRNVLSGDAGDVSISIFDYQYTTGSGKNTRTSRQTVILLESPNINAPAFSMRAQGFFDKFGKALGFQDINFETHPTFSKMFVLQGQNEAAVRSFFSPELLEFFETMPQPCVEGQLGKIIIFHANTLAPPEQLKIKLASAYEIYGRIVDRA